MEGRHAARSDAHRDRGVGESTTARCAGRPIAGSSGGRVKAVKPDYALGNHVAPLGMCFAQGSALGARFANGALLVADDVGNAVWRVTSG